MTAQTYDDLRKRLYTQANLDNCDYIYSVYDVSTGRLYQLNNYDTDQYIEKYFNIILDEFNTSSPVDYPSTYYCNSIKDLEKIVLYTLDHKNIYMTDEDYLADDPFFDFDTVE